MVAIYSTFLQRGYDQLIHDVALQNLDVTFALDRAGLVGADGATHAGNYDIAFLRCIPNMVVATPSDEAEARLLLSTCYQHPGPASVRYPRGAVARPRRPAWRRSSWAAAWCAARAARSPSWASARCCRPGRPRPRRWTPRWPTCASSSRSTAN